MQDAALTRIADAMRAARAGLSDPRRHRLFSCWSHVGHRQDGNGAVAGGPSLWGSQHLTTINLSEFKEEHKVSLLLGSPPGYVGYGEGGVLTEAVRAGPMACCCWTRSTRRIPVCRTFSTRSLTKAPCAMAKAGTWTSRTPQSS